MVIIALEIFINYILILINNNNNNNNNIIILIKKLSIDEAKTRINNKNLSDTGILAAVLLL
jgi:hypothetical protein